MSSAGAGRLDTGARSIGHHDTAGRNGRRTGLPTSSRFGQLPSEPVTYTRVKPRIVVELDVDTAIEHYRWRHACRFVRIRRDLKAADLPPRPLSDRPGTAWAAK